MGQTNWVHLPLKASIPNRYHNPKNKGWKVVIYPLSLDRLNHIDMTILSENQIIYLSTYFFTAHTYNEIINPGAYPEPIKPIHEIAHQLRVNNTDAEALYHVYADWERNLNDPAICLIGNLLDLLSLK